MDKQETSKSKQSSNSSKKNGSKSSKETTSSPSVAINTSKSLSEGKNLIMPPPKMSKEPSYGESFKNYQQEARRHIKVIKNNGK